ncbi:ArnT family glycosyltransferase [Blastopirellula marina]|nr:glycosyltransferase family 39 protein [Blastopirellula marina]
MVATIPILAFGSEQDWSRWGDASNTRPEFQVGPDWIAANRERSVWLTTIARFSCVPFAVVGGLACFLWARDLFGYHAGLLSCALWCFSPNILAHASCVTPDAHAASMGVTAQYLYWRWLRRSTWTNAAIAGVILGLALLTKLTWIVLLLIWPVAWIAYCLLRPSDKIGSKESRFSKPMGLQIIVILGLGIHTLNSVYAYDGTGTRLGDFSFRSSTLSGNAFGTTSNRFVDSLVANVPMPFPDQYIYGIDAQKHDHELHPATYLHGTVYRHGFWYFYIYAMSLKMPIGTTLLFLLATLLALRTHHLSDDIVIASPFITILAVASMETDYTAHFRYVLPALPFAFVWISRLAPFVIPAKPYLTLTVVSLAGLSIASSLSCAPHWISYFNEFAGGPAGGRFFLANSNLDWGQDLLFYKSWRDRNRSLPTPGLAYYGMLNPKDIGIEFVDVPEWIPYDGAAPDEAVLGGPSDLMNPDPAPGWYAVSVNLIMGHPGRIYLADGQRRYLERPHYAWLQALTPVDSAGHSILIFHVTEDDIRRLKNTQRSSPVNTQPAILE